MQVSQAAGTTVYDIITDRLARRFDTATATFYERSNNPQDPYAIQRGPRTGFHKASDTHSVYIQAFIRAHVKKASHIILKWIQTGKPESGRSVRRTERPQTWALCRTNLASRKIDESNTKKL